MSVEPGLFATFEMAPLEVLTCSSLHLLQPPTPTIFCDERFMADRLGKGRHESSILTHCTILVYVLVCLGYSKYEVLVAWRPKTLDFKR